MQNAKPDNLLVHITSPRITPDEIFPILANN